MVRKYLPYAVQKIKGYTVINTWLTHAITALKFYFLKHIFVTKFLDLFILLSAPSVYLAYVLIGASESLSSHLAD